MDEPNYLVLAGFVAACFATASTGAMFSPDEWYERLKKPSWQPPGWLFGPVWMVLYSMIAISGWLVWGAGPWEATLLALIVFAVQLVLNALWSYLFFGKHRPDLALIDVVALLASVLAMIVLFASLHSTAALMLVPYAMWVTFAMILNYTIVRLNPAGDRAGAEA